MLSYPPVELLPKTHPKPKPKHAGDFEVEEHTTATLAGGEYRFHKFKVEKGGTLNLTGEVTLYIEEDFKMDGAKATWKVTCAGPPVMTGEGEITRNGADSWSGAIRFTSPEGAMTVKLNGRRLGECEIPQ